MSGHNAPTSARTPTPYADPADNGGARRGPFSCVLCQTSRPWRRPLSCRLAVGRNKGMAARWQRTIEDSGARHVVRLSLLPGTPDHHGPKKVYHTPRPLCLGTPIGISRPPTALPISVYMPTPKKCAVFFNSRIMEGGMYEKANQ